MKMENGVMKMEKRKYTQIEREIIIRPKREENGVIFRIVVVETRDRNSEIALLGIYKRTASAKPVFGGIKVRRALHWLHKGAQPSAEANRILSEVGVLKHFHDGTRPKKKCVVINGAGVIEEVHKLPEQKKEPKPDVEREVNPMPSVFTNAGNWRGEPGPG